MMIPTQIPQDLADTSEEFAVSYDIAKRWCIKFKCDRQFWENGHTDDDYGQSSTIATT